MLVRVLESEVGWRSRCNHSDDGGQQQQTTSNGNGNSNGINSNDSDDDDDNNGGGGTHARTPMARAVYKGGSRLEYSPGKRGGGDLLEAPCDAMETLHASCRGDARWAVIGRAVQGCFSGRLYPGRFCASKTRQKR